MKTIVVSGSRDWHDRDTIAAVLAAEAAGQRIRLLHGTCRGADRIADAWGREHGHDVVPYPPAAWTREHLLARNRAMLDTGPHLVVVFVAASSRGTWHTGNLALRRGLAVRYVGAPLTPEDVELCHRAAAALAAGPLTMKRQGLWVALRAAAVGDTGNPGLVPAAREILDGARR